MLCFDIWSSVFDSPCWCETATGATLTGLLTVIGLQDPAVGCNCSWKACRHLQNIQTATCEHNAAALIGLPDSTALEAAVKQVAHPLQEGGWHNQQILLRQSTDEVSSISRILGDILFLHYIDKVLVYLTWCCFAQILDLLAAACLYSMECHSASDVGHEWVLLYCCMTPLHVPLHTSTTMYYYSDPTAKYSSSFVAQGMAVKSMVIPRLLERIRQRLVNKTQSHRLPNAQRIRVWI